MYTISFKNIQKEDIDIAGGKGANLGEMAGINIPVPEGFVITSDGYRRFLEYNNLTDTFKNLLRDIGSDESKISDVSKKLRDLIYLASIPEDMEEKIKEAYEALSSSGSYAKVAVRSSATAEDLPDASFAGQQETYLNVQGVEDVLNSVKSCYASLWGVRAISYRLNQGYDQQAVSLAVVIQLMVESEVSGVLFTADPVSGSGENILINASYGLGESVVSGKVTADTIICDHNGRIMSYEIGSKKTQIVYDKQHTREIPVPEEMAGSRALSDDNVSALVQEGLRIESHYGYPMDIEWAIKDNTLYILQARAITTLKQPKENKYDDELIKSYIGNYKISGPAKETMAFQLEKMPYAYRPFDYDLIITINTQKAKLLSESGILMTSDPRMDDDGIMTMPDPKKGISKDILKIPSTLRMLKDYRFCAGKCKEFMPVYEAEVEELKKADIDHMDIKECGQYLKRANDIEGRLCYDRFKYALFPGFLSGKMTRAIRKVNKNYNNYDLYKGLDNKTAVITREVSELAKIISSNEKMKEDILSGMDYAHLRAKYEEDSKIFDSFLSKNGYKSDFNCYCIIAKTLIEDPDRLLNILKPLLHENGSNYGSSDLSSSTEISSSSVDPKQEFEEMMEALHKIYGSKYPSLREEIDCYRHFHIVREESQYLWETIFFYIRKCLNRLNMLLLGNTDYIHGISNLFFAELIDVCNRGSLNDSDLEKISRRDSKHDLSQKVWDASKLLVFDSDGETLKGVSGSRGVVVGEVCIIRSPSEFYKMKKGNILVCELTDPEWTPLFKLASGVVADTGSSLSHAAIVAREFKIPAVLGVGFATNRYKDGDMIKVDGNSGIVNKVKTL